MPHCPRFCQQKKESCPLKNSTEKIDVSVIIAVYNYGKNTESLCDKLKMVLQSTRKSFELIFVDDGSEDETYDILYGLANQNDQIKVVRMRSTFGEASALEAGLRYSVGDQIIYVSGRVRVNPEGFPALLEQLDHGYDFVVGRRFPRRDSKLNQMISWMFNRMVSGLMKIRLHDINSGVFASYRSVLQKISFYSDLYNFIPILASQQGYKVVEKNIEQLPGAFRVSKSPKEYLQRMLDILTVFFLTRYSKKPIHFMGFLGMIFCIAGLIIELYLFVYRVMMLGPIAGRPLLLLGALLLVIGIQMITIGLLGEMIIFSHAGDIEEYNIEAVVQKSKGDES